MYVLVCIYTVGDKYDSKVDKDVIILLKALSFGQRNYAGRNEQTLD